MTDCVLLNQRGRAQHKTQRPKERKHNMLFAIMIAALFALFTPVAAAAATTVAATIVAASTPIIVIAAAAAAVTVVGSILGAKVTGDAALVYGPGAWAASKDTVVDAYDWLVENGVPAALAEMMAMNGSTTKFTVNHKGFWNGTPEGAFTMHIQDEVEGEINWFVCSIKRNEKGEWNPMMTSEPRAIGEERPALITE